MKNTIKLIGVIALVAIIGFSACDTGNGDNGNKSIDTTALNDVINEATLARDGVEKASNASEVPTGKKWVTESEWNAFDSVYKAAAEAKANPSSQSAVDTAKTNLQAAIVTFNTAKKNGSAAAITLSGTITVKNNGQIVPYVMIHAHTEEWDWQETLKIPSPAANTQWSIITKPFSSFTDIFFDISGYDNDKYENALFSEITAVEKAAVHNADVSNIAINMDLNFITISGTLSLDYGKVIPSIQIDINKKDGTNVRLGAIHLLNVGSSAAWSTIIPAQTVDTDVVFSITGFDGPIPYEYDQLFALWGKDFGVKVKNQNKTDITINLITISGTVNVAYNGGRVPSVIIHISEKLGGDWLWVTNTTLNSPSANAPWSIVIPAYTGDTEISIAAEGKDGSDNSLFWTWVADKTVKNTNVSGIAINLITLSGTINVTYNGSTAPFVRISFNKGDEGIGGLELNSPSTNAPWSVVIPAFTSDTEIRIDVGVGNDENDDNMKWIGGVVTRTVKNTNVSGIVLNPGNITE